MDLVLESSFQASSEIFSDSDESRTSRPFDCLDNTVSNSEKSDSSPNITAMASSTGSQPASLDVASADTMNENTNEAHTLTTSVKNHSEFIEEEAEKSENVSGNSTLNMLDAADIEPNSPPSESPPGEDGMQSGSQVSAEVYTTDETCLSPVVPSDILQNVYDVPSSSPPTSSPFTSRYFRGSTPIPTASSPHGYDSTPPTSPVKILKNVESNFDQSVDLEETALGGDEVMEVSDDDPTTSDTDQGVPQKKVYQRLIPGPKRATLAAQQVQRQRLSKPFRPPAVQKPDENENRQDTILITAAGEKDVACKSGLRTSSFVQKMQEKMKKRTAKASAQFKSPLASSGSEAGGLVRPTPTIQALERKLQLLKRAVKVKENAEEELLTGLIQKWTEAGREIGWEVWGLVKDNDEVVNMAGRKRQVEDSWGWQDGSDSKRPKTEERLWGWDVVPVHEREVEGSGRTVGTMLVEMGIAPETFGWDADEERFV